MSKSMHNNFLDGGPSYGKTNINKVTLCSQAPTTYTEANATYELAAATVGSADWTVADDDGAGGGRMLTLAQQAIARGDVTGTANHIAMLKTGTSELCAVNELSADLGIVGGSPCIVPTFAIRFKDPV